MLFDSNVWLCVCVHAVDKQIMQQLVHAPTSTQLIYARIVNTYNISELVFREKWVKHTRTHTHIQVNEQND